jgi:hypothetical protein
MRDERAIGPTPGDRRAGSINGIALRRGPRMRRPRRTGASAPGTAATKEDRSVMGPPVVVAAARAADHPSSLLDEFRGQFGTLGTPKVTAEVD